MIGSGFVGLAGDVQALGGVRSGHLVGGSWERGGSELAYLGRAGVEGFEANQGSCLVADQELAVELLSDFDAAVGVRAAAGGGLDGEAVAAERDGVVLGDDAFVLEAEDGIGHEAGGPGAVGGSWLGGRDDEAGVVAGQEVVQDAVGIVQGAGVSLAQGFDEAVLEGAEETLDASFGLGRIGREELDGKLMEEAGELAARRLAGQLFADGGLLGALEDGVAVGVDSQRKAVREGDVLQEEEVAGGVFFGAEEGSGDVARGVVDSGDEAELGASAFKPVVLTAIELEEHTGLGTASTPGAVARGALLARTGQAGPSTDPPDAGAGEVDGVVFVQHVGQVMVVVVGVGGPGQGKDFVPDLGGDAPGRRTTPVAMG
jgi:hypothetical protein